MAKKIQYAWGLEIGQSALKALRCHMEGDQIVADTFDFVEYPKILSQPEAEPEMLVADALSQFISRNDLRAGAKIGVSVPGQSGLAKFFKPPPVEVKKIADIVKYEAKQQIPFDLKDVIWDFQQMAGAQIEDGYALESEVGLFAMKREAVIRALKPFRDLALDIDLVQLAPMSIYNMISHDQFAESMATESFDPDHPQPSKVILSLGTDASDLIVTNGFRVWQRSIPIGGNHFTRQLTKDLKLTFAKAEHLKRNAMQADDPKLVFQAMRPVFNDLVTEIQRSLNFYKTLNKKSELDSIILLGNTAKLPGLQQFMAKNLGMDISILEKFPKLTGNEVIGAQAFKENVAAFGVVYGMCLQLFSQGPMTTNLLPREIVIDRVVRNKKPWAIGALSVLLVGMVANHTMMGMALSKVQADSWKDSEGSVNSLESESNREKQEDDTLKNKIKLFSAVGKEVSSGAKRRIMCLELLKSIEASLNRNPADEGKSPLELPYSSRKDFHISKIEQKYVGKLDEWFTKALFEEYKAQTLDRCQLLGIEVAQGILKRPIKPASAVSAAPSPAPKSAAPATTADKAKSSSSKVIEDPKLKGPGWVVEITGYHYFNGVRGEEGRSHLNKYLIDFLERGKIMLPDENGVLREVFLGEIGIEEPIIRKATVDPAHRVPNPEYVRRMMEKGLLAPPSGSGRSTPGFGGPGLGTGGASSGMIGEDNPTSGGGGGGGAAGAQDKRILDDDGKEIPPDFPAPRCDFVVQFAWKPASDKQAGGATASAAATAPAAPASDGGDKD